jgi:hypothetical protein
MPQTQEVDRVDVGWGEPYAEDSDGVDHLGIRTAGEVAYARLLDFVTTVSWRPRYLSMLCWALDRAWKRHAQERPDGTTEVKTNEWRACVRRADYLVAAATLTTTPSVPRINGVTPISAALATGDDFRLDVRYVQTDSLGLYNGILRTLGLSRDRESLDALTPVGEQLGSLFSSAADLDALADSEAVARSTLAEIGKSINLTQLSEAEADLLRSLTLRWDALEQDQEPGWAGQTVGLLLRFQELHGGRGTVDDFRDAVVAGVVGSTSLLGDCNLPVAARWSAYQVHANAAFALEVFLAAYLDLANPARIEADHRAIVDSCVQAAKQAGVSGAISGLIPQSPRSAQPPLVASIKKLSKPSPATLGERLRAALGLFVASVTQLSDRDIQTSWVGSKQPDRLPPAVLVTWLDDLLATDAVDGMVLLLERVLHQHERTALRKLMADPRKDTIKFLRDGNKVRALSSHRAAHSYPRFANAMTYLTDLGLLDTAGKPTALGAEYERKVLQRSHA